MTVLVSTDGSVSATVIDPTFNEPYILHLTDGAVGSFVGYVFDTYADELEYLWKKFPDNAIWRRKDTNKWYGALLTVSKRKLGIKSDEMVEIIDLRIAPENMEVLPFIA